MLNKINELSVAAYVKTSAFFRGLKSDERGLSGVVVAVLLILVAVLAIVMLWGSQEISHCCFCRPELSVVQALL